MTTRQAAVDSAGRTLARARDIRDQLTPREAALRAHYPGGPDLDTLTDRIAAQRQKVKAAA